jgi:hypothetical protein
VVFSRPTLWLAALLLWLPACGLFVSESLPPSLEEVANARAAEANDWALLEEAWIAVEDNPYDSLQAVANLRQQHPKSVRLAMFEQDLQLQHMAMAQVRSSAKARYEEQPSGLHSFLYARVTQAPEARDALLVDALERDPDLVQARVAQLAHAAFAGDTEVLVQIIELLNENPGSAQAWRLLGTLAPLFDRRDLAHSAAATEPWSPFDSIERATYTVSRRALQDGFPEFALKRARELPPGTSQTINLQAAALAALGQADVALGLIDDFLADHPQDRVAVFNRALLLRDYLGRANEAALELERFLQLEEEQGGSDLMRRMQAELWLGRGTQP